MHSEQTQVVFVLYINDLPSIFSLKIHIDLFADDTQIYFSYTSESEIFLIQNNIIYFHNYLPINGQINGN